MKDVEARRLSIRIAQVAERWDHWSFMDTLADFDNNEELLLEYQAKEISENPVMVFDWLLEVMECMLDNMDM